MLDHEPEYSDVNHNPEDTPADGTPPPRRRRRAATRPAGPPKQLAEPSEPSEPSNAESQLADDPIDEEVPAAEPQKPAKRTRRSAKAAQSSPAESSPVESSPAETLPSESSASESSPTESTPSESSPSESSSTESAPTEAPARARRSRKKAAPVPEPEVSAQPELMAEPEVAAVEPTEQIVADLEPTDQLVTAAETTEQVVVDPTVDVDGGTEESSAEADTDDDTDDDASPSDSASDSDQAEDDEDDGSGSRRRRRRRGGRRRRRGAGESEDDSRAGSNDDQPAATEGADRGSTSDRGVADDENRDESDNDDSDGDSDGEGGRRRRRRRRRRGEDAAAAPDDPTEVVVRVREPRSRRRPEGVAGIDGSTRMEAKRQRRREGREAGRRRAPILSEAEFLARREAVSRKMIIRQRDDLSQIAVIEDDILVEHYVDRDSAASLIGNVYLGRVQNVLPSMEAAFIDIGRGRNAVLYAGEVDWTSFGGEGQHRKIESVLKSGTTVLVQVTKDPVGAKGARLTNHVSIPGRYIVYAPGGHLSGISRKLPDVERKRLKSILSDLVPESASVIVRTAAEGASEDELVRDVNRLKAQWEDIEGKVKAGSSPQLLYGEPDLTVRIVRDLFTEDFGELIIQGTGSMTDAYEAVEAYVTHVAPHLQDRLRRWDTDAEGDLFGAFRLDEQIAKGLERKVFLPSGGSLVIDRTEAMTVIDVNTGKFTGSGGNLEATVTSNNLEAAEEVVRQLRLRDIGGIIVIDFIDMVLPSNRELLLRRLVECLGRDRTRHQVAEVTSLGLVQMTRKKIGTGLLEAFSTECPHCSGRGYEVHDMPVETQKQPDGGARDNNRSRDRSRNERSGSRGKMPRPPELKPSEPKPTPPQVAEPAAEQSGMPEPSVEPDPVESTPENSQPENSEPELATAPAGH